jgi:uncharacterized protein (TIGR02145 family)
MKNTLSVIILTTVLLFAMSAIAQNKVVVIPLNSQRVATTTCTAPDEVMSQGKCWKDRNLGASQVATSSNDTAAYGDLYQWGRLGGGHQNRNSTLVATNSENDVPGHPNFIPEPFTPWDWRAPQNDNLWQGLGGVNNPCPQGFRLPTESEWEIERVSWSSNDAAGAFASPLKLAVTGYRNYSNGSVGSAGFSGGYWSGAVDGSYTRSLVFNSGTAAVNSYSRAYGFTVRCIKD